MRKREKTKRIIVSEIPSDILLTHCIPVHLQIIQDWSPSKAKAKHRCSTATARAHSGFVAQWASTAKPSNNDSPQLQECQSSHKSASASKLHLPECNTFSAFHTGLGLQQWESETWGQEKKRKHRDSDRVIVMNSYRKRGMKMVQSHKRHKSHRAVTDTHTHTHCHRKTRTGTGHSPTPRNKKTLILQKQFYKEQLLERTTKTCSLKQRVENMFRTHAHTHAPTLLRKS